MASSKTFAEVRLINPKLRDPAVLLLTALLAEQTVELPDGLRYRLIETEAGPSIAVLGVRQTPGEAPAEVFLNADHLTLTDFIRAAQGMTFDAIAEVMGNVTLQQMNTERAARRASMVATRPTDVAR
jgi:hypothetical protein